MHFQLRLFPATSQHNRAAVGSVQSLPVPALRYREIVPLAIWPVPTAPQAVTCSITHLLPSVVTLLVPGLLMCTPLQEELLVKGKGGSTGSRRGTQQKAAQQEPLAQGHAMAE